MKWLTKSLKFLFGIGISGIFAGILALAGIYLYLEPDLPSIDTLKNTKFQVPLRVFARDGKLIAEFGEKRRIPQRYEEIPERMIQAFLAAEDDRFFEHPGVDYHGILRAAYQLMLTGERRQGGSTITMQVARNFYLSSEKTYTRKLSEIFLALRIERDLSKQKILELYLNKIYMGNRAYGVGAAAQVYYGKQPGELLLEQVAMIAGLPKAPSRYNPLADPERALIRRNYVLDRMLELEYISAAEHQAAVSAPVSASLHSAQVEVEAPYLAEMVRTEMIDRYGNDAYTDGYTVITTLDSRLQGVANGALRHALQEYDTRHGYRGAERHLTLSEPTSVPELDALLKDIIAVGDLQPAIVTEVAERQIEVYLGNGIHRVIDWPGLEWASPYIDENRRGEKPATAGDIVQRGDLIRLLDLPPEDGDTRPHFRLAQIPNVEGALVALHPDDGAVLSLVGGYDFFNSKFNRVVQARRQPGSGFKAIIYSAALEAGFTPASLINDAPVVFDDPSLEAAWRPENYSGKFFGPTRLRYALTKSRNLVSIRLLRRMGIDHALRHAALFGFDPNELPHNLSLALGSASVSPMQMASAYSILANGGYRIEPYFISRIEDSLGTVLHEANPPRVIGEGQAQDASRGEPAGELPHGETDTAVTRPEPVAAPRVISEQNHYLMNSMMRDVITRGTARKARSLGRNDLAGKTGTTNDQRDAWFNGFNRSMVAIAWVGFDSFHPLGRGEVGGRAALPAWIEFMEEALKGVEEQPLPMPPGLITVRIDPKTGMRASVDQKDAIFEVFRTENAPKETAPSETPGGKSGNQGTGGGETELF